MKILALNHGHPPFARGGLERSGQVAIEGLADLGHEMLVLAGEVPDPTRAALGFPRELREDVRVERCLPALWLHESGSVVKHARRLAQDARSAKLTREQLAEFDPDAILILHFAVGISHVVPWVLLETGLPTVIYSGDGAVGGFDRASWLRHLAPGRGRGSARDRAVGGVVAAANRLTPSLRVRFVPGTRISRVSCSSFTRSTAQPNPAIFEVEESEVVYMGTPHHDALARAAAAGHLRSSDVVFVGRLVRDKGADIAVRAMAKVREAVPGSRLVIIGNDPASDYGNELRALAAELGLNGDALRFAGTADSDQLADWLGKSGAVVVPSRWDEPSGKIMIESALAQIPIVASRVGGVPELMHEGSHARFFDREDHGRCADLLIEALTEKAETLRMVRAAADRAAGFTQEATAATFERLLVGAAARRASRQAVAPGSAGL